jgi:hypothetical protein
MYRVSLGQYQTGLTCKIYKLAMDKHSNLVVRSFSDGEKSFMISTPGVGWSVNHRMSYKKLSKGLELIEKYKETGANAIKLFLPVIYTFSYKARAFVRMGLKSLPGTNTSFLQNS